MTSPERPRREIKTDWVTLPEADVTILVPDTWRFKHTRDAESNVYRFIPGKGINPHSYNMGLSLRVVENGFLDGDGDEQVEGFLKNQIHFLTSDIGAEDVKHIEMDGPFRSKIGEMREKEYDIGGKNIKDKWNLARVVLNMETGTFYEAAIRLPQTAFESYQEVSRKIISTMKFGLQELP